jgi:signal transduction histidine kinase
LSASADELEQLRGSFPKRLLHLELRGDTQETWSGLRVQQLLGKLVSNAIKYGTPVTAIRVAIFGSDSDVQKEVRAREQFATDPLN